MKKTLSQLSLFKKVIADPQLSIIKNPYDSNWKYEKYLRSVPAGFNPYTGNIYVPTKSALVDWMDEGMKNDRNYNEADILLHEFTFLLHDYLHVWSASRMHEIMLDIGLNEKPPTPEMADKFVFLHLLTETAAVVGLDYWYLSTFKLAEKCDLGTCYTSLTVSYDEDDIEEYRKFYPDFTVQEPKFFSFLQDFYCTGEFKGFGLEAMRQSPKIYSWLKHELEYGETQRKYIRMWYAHLSNGVLNYTEEELKAPIDPSKHDFKPLVDQVQDELWKLIKTKDFIGIQDNSALPYPLIQSKADYIDFQFTNIHVDFDQMMQKCMKADLNPMSKNAALVQLVSSFPYEMFPEELRVLLAELIRGQKLELVAQLFQYLKLKPHKVLDESFKDLFYLE